MELQQFITETLNQILRGVAEAKNTNGCIRTEISPNLKHYFDATHESYVGGDIKPPGDVALTSGGQIVVMVDFDVVLSKSDGSQNKGGIGVYLGGVGIGTQAIADAQDKSETTIHFRVPVVLPH
jgi:hypothetical protein